MLENGAVKMFRGFCGAQRPSSAPFPRKFLGLVDGARGEEEDDDKDIGLWYRHSRGETIDTRKQERRGVKFQVPSINQSVGNDEI